MGSCCFPSFFFPLACPEGSEGSVPPNMGGLMGAIFMPPYPHEWRLSRAKPRDLVFLGFFCFTNIIHAEHHCSTPKCRSSCFPKASSTSHNFSSGPSCPQDDMIENAPSLSCHAELQRGTPAMLPLLLRGCGIRRQGGVRVRVSPICQSVYLFAECSSGPSCPQDDRMKKAHLFPVLPSFSEGPLQCFHCCCEAQED